LKKILLVIFFLIVAIGLILAGSFIGVYYTENMHRAQKCYEEGETFFKQKDYKQAMWRYQEVSEFYSNPHTDWLDLAKEKEWICRAYLNDWIPPEGPLDKDVRVLHPDLYAKYKTELVQITPVQEKSN